MIDTVLFDFDGTIMNTAPVIIASWQHAFRTLQGREESEDIIYASFGEPLEVTAARFFPEVPVEESVECYRSFHQDRFIGMIELFPGMREAVLAVREAGCRTGLVTSRVKTTTYRGLEAFDLLRLMDTVVTVNDCPAHKPDPGPALMALKALGSDPKHTMMLGDTRFDLGCARNAGCKAVLVDWAVSLDPASLTEEEKPDAVLKDPAKITDLLTFWEE